MAIKKDKIALISGHFMPEVGYQEVQLAKSYSNLGYSVRVFTSNKVSPSSKALIKKDYRLGLTKDVDFGYEILRLPTTFSFNSIIICKDLKKEVINYKPDYIIIQGVGKLFPYKLFQKSISKNIKIITLLGNNIDMMSSNTLFGKVKYYIINSVIKKFVYNLAVKYSNRIVVYTLSTESIIEKIVSQRFHKMLKEKIHVNTLGFDDSVFYHDYDIGERIRVKLGIPVESTVLITSTRIVKNKNIENTINIIDSLHRKGADLHYIICGFLGDDYEKQVVNYIKKNTYKNDNFHLIPFANHKEINEYYNASDFGLWKRAAISIQEAMGTGLMVIIPNRTSVNHLVKDGFNGWYYLDKKGSNDIETIIYSAIKNLKNNSSISRTKKRQTISLQNKDYLSYNSIATNIIKDL